MKFPFFLFAVGCLTAGSGYGVATETPQTPELRGPVHPRRNVEEFPARAARWLRFTILQTNWNEPCLDELEVFGPDDPARNLALASAGTRVRSSGTLDGYRIHDLSHLNDGLYGNGHSWIASTKGMGWVELEFPEPVVISRVVWSRDRERKFIDRLATAYRVELADEQGMWEVVASSDDRQPLPMAPEGSPLLSGWPDLLSGAYSPSPNPGNPAAGEYLLQTWLTADGLPSSTVTAIRQTRDGWLWIGTTNGLARFDGARFTPYGEADGLPNLAITCLFEDHAGTLWAGTEGGGLSRLVNGRFLAARTGQGLAANTVMCMAEDAAGVLWVGTGADLGIWDGKVFTSRFAGPVSRLASTPEGMWMIHPDRRLMGWNGQDVVLLPAALDRSRFSSISALAAGAEGSIWFGGANGYVVHLKDGTVTTFGEGQSALSSNVVALLPDARGDLWVGTSAGGLARMREKQWLHLTTDEGLPSNAVRALWGDPDGRLWVGTAGGGLTCLRPRRVQSVTTREGLSHNAVMALCSGPGGEIWIGTNGGGLNRWDGSVVTPQTPSYLLENQSIPSLAVRQDGSFWLGTSGQGAYRLEPGATGPLSVVAGLPGSVVTALCEDLSGRLWFGTLDGGPVCMEGEILTSPPGIAALAGLPVTSIMGDSGGRVWFGTNGQGVARLDPDGINLSRWTRDNGLASSFVRTLKEDSTGTVWAGTSGGITRWKAGRISNFDTSHGLPDPVVSQIIDDGRGSLWIGTNRGIARVPLASFDQVAAGEAETLEVLVLGREDGLPALECTGGYHPAGLRTPGGLLCFGTVGGLAVINPANFPDKVPPPPVVIETVAVGGGLPDLPSSGAPLLVPSASRLAFEFTALAFHAPERVRFRHRLKGIDQDWSPPSAARTATYANPAPGDFQFEVIASADGGSWSTTPARVAFRVLSPWWRKPWAVTSGTVLGVAVIAGVARTVTRRRLQGRLRELERQFALERERSRIARDIHDDLGANLTQISLISATGAEQSHDPEKVREKFTAISTTSGELVQAMDAIVWAVNPRHDTVESLARYLVRFAGDFFAATPIRLRLDVPPQLPHAVLGSELRHNLFLAVKEALHNVLQHSHSAEAWLRISTRDTTLIIDVADDGCGFSPAPAHHGNGLGNMHFRLNESGGTCQITSTPGHGTRVQFSIPLPTQGKP